MAKPTKAMLDRAVADMQRYLGALGKVRVRDEQRFYDRAMKSVRKIAERTGMDVEDVWDQVEAEARRRGTTLPMPGKDFNPCLPTQEKSTRALKSRLLQ